MRSLYLTVVALAAVAACAEANYLRSPETALSDIGNGLWRTFGFEDVLPVNASSAKSKGWYQTGDCDSDQGIVFSENKSGPSKDKPLELMFTANGQFAGCRVTIYGESSTSSVGPAAQPSLVHAGYWIVTPGKSETWYMTVSTRPSSEMCSGSASDSLLGDRLVINQGSLDYSIPLTARDAQAQGYVPGSCMETMGQHWMRDITERNNLTWVAGNLQPVVPMYYPPFDYVSGTIHAIFFTTPVAQPGSLLFGYGDWETPALTASLMCQNFCKKDCHWNTNFWSTMHIYFNSDWKNAKCPGGSGIVDRSCSA